ncbi:MAG TPA: radical SAM family heme chaperone HemW [Desulfomonilaceae bacterium]|nr:radical SAM family heme chaperone HemW [Desulfomonilaceae bacterium]
MTGYDPVFPQDAALTGIYVHVPFCRGRCNYCGFVTYPHHPDLEENYVKALTREIDLWAQTEVLPTHSRSFQVDTLYFGGGTPSILRPASIAQLIDAWQERFEVVPDPEITVEINPATVKVEQLKHLRRAGVNRASLGIQSFEDHELIAMGRRHNASDALIVFEDARVAGFDNISIDLIAGFPGQSMASLRRSLETALDLNPEHLSIYLLEVKEGTELQSRIREGRIQAPDDDLAASLYEYICETVKRAGYEHYEISNFARHGYFSRHNLKYWQDATYIGLGAAAHGMIGRHRYSNVQDLDRYGQLLAEGQLPFHSFTELTPENRFRDALIMGARLVQGVDLQLLGNRYNIDVETFVRGTVGDLEDSGLFTMDGGRLALTPRGRLLSNVIFARWV